MAGPLRIVQGARVDRAGAAAQSEFALRVRSGGELSLQRASEVLAALALLVETSQNTPGLGPFGRNLHDRFEVCRRPTGVA
jgi:hypothetical protein